MRPLATHRSTRLVAAVLLLGTPRLFADSTPDAPAPPAPAAAVPAASIGDYGSILWHDTEDVFTAPASWDEDAWLKFGAASIAVVGTAVALDKPIRDAAARNTGSGVEHFANNFEKFGAEYSFGVIGAFYVGGLVAGDSRSRLVGEDALAASIISGSITYVLKEAVGRSRPVADRGAFSFSPFSGNASFPSGHTTQAFAVASVIAARYNDNLWVDLAAYGTATLVGVARIDHRAHFASDVLAGALIGNFVGRTIVCRRGQPAGHVAFEPVAAPGFAGFVGNVSF